MKNCFHILLPLLAIATPVIAQPAPPSWFQTSVTRTVPPNFRSTPNLIVAPISGQITRALPGQIVRPLSGQVTGGLPGQIIRPLPGQVVRALPGQIVGPLPGQIVP